MSSLRAGLIGLGHQGRAHFESLCKLRQQGLIELAAVCDTCSEKLCASDLDGLGKYTSFQNMISNERLDFVVAAVPNHAYRPLLVACFEKKIHVLKEKPFGLTLNEAQDFFAMAVENDCILAVAQQRKFNPLFEKASESIGLLGHIQLLDYRFTLNDTRPSWYWNKQEGGGSWFGLGWHACFVIHYFLGIPKTVQNYFLSSNKRAFPYQTDDTNVVILNFENGAIAKAMVSVVSTEKSEYLYISGSSGNMKISRKELQITDNNGALLVNEGSSIEGQELYTIQLKDFISRVMQNDIRSESDAFEVMAMIEAGVTSGSNKGIPVIVQKPVFRFAATKLIYSY